MKGVKVASTINGKSYKGICTKYDLGSGLVSIQWTNPITGWTKEVQYHMNEVNLLFNHGAITRDETYTITLPEDLFEI